MRGSQDSTMWERRCEERGSGKESESKGWSEQEAGFLILKHREVSVSEKMQEETWKRTKGEERKIKPSGTEGIAGNWERVLESFVRALKSFRMIATT